MQIKGMWTSRFITTEECQAIDANQATPEMLVGIINRIIEEHEVELGRIQDECECEPVSV